MAASTILPVLPLRQSVLAVALALVGIAQGATAADDNAALLQQLKKLNERIEKLENRNQELEKRLESVGSAEQRIRALEEANARMDQALQSERLSEKEPELATRLKAVEFQTLSMQKQARQIEALEGITVSASLTGVLQSTNSAGAATATRESRTNYRGDIAVSLPGGELGDVEGKIFTHLRIGQGNGVGLRPTYTSTPNTTAFQVQSTNANPDDSFGILAQAWYQLNVPLPIGGYKPHSRESMRLTFGKIDPFVFFDQNVAADDESTKFLNNAFVHNPLLDSGGDVGADQYGFSPGLIAGYVDERSKPESWGASVGVFGSGPGANFSGSQSRPFVIGQLETSQRLAGGLTGNYRLYAWTNGRATNFDGAQARHSGWGVSADQRVGDAMTLFGRYGHKAAGRVRFDRALTLGTEFGGDYWGRAADSIGVAAGFLRTSAAFRNESATVDADGDGNPDFGFAASGTERIGELYYRFRVNSRFELSPDLQFIRRPGGNAAAPSMTLVGLRAKVGF
ncbi:MAG: hypothetical protein A3G24_05845 [Betaproteobacteria bacterium RIFCSPLOWO2_12_FULL_62_13]|nr:MAG: hypothetical protein A3G24_05845 [Betaproteobacteria bacterium RIFCSPLOWO2_12_FULL_62_13]